MSKWVRWRGIGACLVVSALVATACGGGAEEASVTSTVADTPTTAAPAAELSLGATSAESFERVPLDGLPAEDFATVWYWIEESDQLPRAVLLDDDGPFIVAPIHPTAPLEGGTLTLRFVDAERDLATLALDVTPPPVAPGAFSDAVEELADSIAVRADSLGYTVDEIRTAEPDDLTPPARPLWVALTWLDVTEATLAGLDGDQLELVDRVTAAAGFGDLFAAQAIAYPDPPEPGQASGGGQFLSAQVGCIDIGPDIFGTEQLAAAMSSSARASVATDPNLATGRTLEAMGWVLTGGGFLPGYGAGFGALSTLLAGYQGVMSGIAGLYPSMFTNIKTTVDPVSFDEDSTVLGRWTEVELTAASTGWTADADVVNVLTNLTGFVASAIPTTNLLGDNAEAVEGVVTALAQSLARGIDLATDAASTTTNQLLNDVMRREDGGSVISFCPQSWDVIVSEDGYVDGRALRDNFSVDARSRSFEPKRLGDDILRVDVLPGQFGGRYIKLDTPLEIREIEMLVSASKYVVVPGEEIEITAAIENAETETLYWNPGPGSWADGIGDDTNGPTTRTLVTPTDITKYPFSVVVEATTRTGLRATATDKREGGVVIVAEGLIITPNPAVLEAGEEIKFVATDPDGNAVDVTWEAEIGDIDPDSGIYVAGGEPIEDVVTATSNANEDITGSATVFVVADVGVCRYATSVMMGEAFGAVFGEGEPFEFFGNQNCTWTEQADFCEHTVMITGWDPMFGEQIEASYRDQPELHVDVPGTRAFFDPAETMESQCTGIPGGPGPEPAGTANFNLFVDGRWILIQVSGPVVVEPGLEVILANLGSAIYERATDG